MCLLVFVYKWHFTQLFNVVMILALEYHMALGLAKHQAR